METTAVKLYSTGYREAKTYLAAALFVAGNIVLPQICHLVPQGGLRWLPIYFFTLVGAYKYGWRVGLLTAVLSPAVNSALFGMPAAAMLPVILLKSVLLAGAAFAWLSLRTGQGDNVTPNSQTIRYTVVFQKMAQGDSQLIQPGDKLYIPGIRRALEDGAETITGILTQGDRQQELPLKLERLTREDRDIILSGCLINYYAK